MSRKQNVPILKHDSYIRSYFKDQADPGLVHTPAAGHFQLHHKCLWKNVIQTHRLDFYMVILVTAGEGIQTLGLRQYYVQKNSLCFISPAMIASWESGEEEQHRGYFCTFSEDFISPGMANKPFLAQLPFFQIDGPAVLQLNEEQMAYFTALFELMQADYSARNSYIDHVFRSHLQALLYKTYALYYEGGASLPKTKRQVYTYSKPLQIYICRTL